MDAYYKFCPLIKGDSNIDRSGTNGIVNGQGSLDNTNMKASISWTRPLDVSGDKTLTLIGNTTNKIWLTWGNYLADIDINALTLNAKKVETDGKDFFIPAPLPI